MSATTEEQWKKMRKIVEDFMSRPDCEPFREPVPWKEMGLTDYPVIIKNPMDLGSILKRLKTGNYYKTVYQAGDDVRLVWSNCMSYNADGSDFYKLAESLQKRFDDKYSKLLQDIGAVNTTEVSKVSLQDKRNMAKLLYQISKEDLGKILVEIEQKCPAGIKRNSAEDELELNVDALTGQVLKEVTEHLQGMVSHQKQLLQERNSGSKSKKAKTAQP